MSDTGLLEVARRCSGLTVLELSRSELPFKVGDVTLMVRSSAGVTYQENKTLLLLPASDCSWPPIVGVHDVCRPPNVTTLSFLQPIYQTLVPTIVLQDERGQIKL